VLAIPERLVWYETILFAEKAMASIAACPTCKKPNTAGGRYCIYCGAILRPVYCSSCGTSNPDGLERCLECGSQLPRLTDIRWNPIVTVLQPTSAMVDSNLAMTAQDTEFVFGEQEEARRTLLSRFRSMFSQKQDEKRD
jgi:hypothetical protein